MVLLRQPFGDRGAEAISFLLLVTNFAWIALNNVIAARALAGIVARQTRACGRCWWARSRWW